VEEPGEPTGETGLEHQERERILLWMDALEYYGRDWDKTFENKASYFTQEFWYLLVNCLVNHWNGTPLSVSGACQQMKTGSNRTREARIKKAVTDGYLLKEKSDKDHREAFVIPSPKLEALMVEHFERTLGKTQEILQAIRQSADHRNKR